MSGAVVSVLKPTLFDVTSLPDDEKTFQIPAQVDVRLFREATILVRIHALTIASPEEGSFSVWAVSTAPAACDPGRRFSIKHDDYAVSVSTYDQSRITDAEGILLRSIVPSPFGPFLDFEIWGTPGTIDEGIATAVVSIDLVLKR